MGRTDIVAAREFPAPEQIALKRHCRVEDADTALSPEVRLQKRVQLFLRGACIPTIRGVRVAVDRDTVVLQGTVQTFYQKQMAQEFAKRVAGVMGVVNLIEVTDGQQLRPRTKPEEHVAFVLSPG